MSNVDDVLAGCFGKVTFATYSSAARIQKRRARGDREFRKGQVYRCRSCGSYHIGTRAEELNKKEVNRFMHRFRNRRGRDDEADAYAT